MQHITGIIAIIMVFSIPLAAIIGAFYLRLQKMKMSQGGGDSSVADLRTQIGNLMAENDEIKERLKNLEYLSSDESRRIDLDYEQEQIKIDQQNKFNS